MRSGVRILTTIAFSSSGSVHDGRFTPPVSVSATGHWGYAEVSMSTGIRLAPTLNMMSCSDGYKGSGRTRAWSRRGAPRGSGRALGKLRIWST